MQRDAKNVKKAWYTCEVVTLPTAFFFRSPCRHRCLSHKTEFGQGNIMFLKVNQNGPRRYSKENEKKFS